MQNKAKRIISFMILVLWMGVIFSFSAKVATESGAQSSGVVRLIEDFLEKIFPKARNISAEEWHSFEILLRKTAHGVIYFVLGILCANFIASCAVHRKTVISAAICLIYAISDEIHQVFVPGRSGQISDVIIDFSGSIIGIYLFILIFRRLTDRRNS